MDLVRARRGKGNCTLSNKERNVFCEGKGGREVHPSLEQEGGTCRSRRRERQMWTRLRMREGKIRDLVGGGGEKRIPQVPISSEEGKGEVS